jgi:hypothetical protein
MISPKIMIAPTPNNTLRAGSSCEGITKLSSIIQLPENPIIQNLERSPDQSIVLEAEYKYSPIDINGRLALCP